MHCQKIYQETYIIGASLSEPHTSESPPQILVLSTMHKKLRQKSDNLHVRREFNGIDYSAFLYGSCNRYRSVDKACGPDLLPAKLLKEGAESICVPLSHLFQRSFEVGILPFDWISAHVVPVFKCGDRHKPANYRPISLTSLVVKAMEKVIHSHIILALEARNLLNTFQFSFRSRRSTINLLLRTSHDMALGPWKIVHHCIDCFWIFSKLLTQFPMRGYC